MTIIAWVVPKQFSDGSEGYDVVMDTSPGGLTSPRVVIGAANEGHAHQIAEAINDGAVWVEVQD